MEQTKRFLIIAALLVGMGLPGACATKAKPTPVAKPAPKPKAGTANVLPGASIALPSSSKVKVRWVCPPLDTKAVDKAIWYPMHFVVDGKGRPWFGTQWSSFINPLGCYKFKLSGTHDDMACLENGAFLVANHSDLGFIVPPSENKLDYEGIPVVAFQPISSLPVRDCKIYPGSGNCLYLVGTNPKTKLHDVYLLKQEKLTNQNVGLREYVKVLSSEKPINAVAGDGSTTYVAVDRVVLKSARSGGMAKVFAHPREDIKSLAYIPQVGLFYGAYTSVGYVGSKTHMQILGVDEPEVYLQKGSLYILLTKSLGVLALDNISDLKRFDRPVAEVPATQSKDVKVTAVRLFEAGETLPDYADRKYAKEFEKYSTRFVYCQVDLENLAKGKRSHKQVISIELQWPHATFRGSGETTLEFAKDTPDAWGWVRFGSKEGGYFYPGKYTVRTSLNGCQIDERYFTVKGEPSLLEAAYSSDAAMVRKLLEEGADPNVISSEGDTPLIIAATQGSTEISRILLEHKADANTKNNDGSTALLIATSAYTDNSELVQLLVERGADVSVTGKNGQTPLHRAARGGMVKAMRALLEHGADPNAKDKDGVTPFLALDFGSLMEEAAPTQESIELMLSHGANVNAANAHGRTALQDAVDKPSPPLVRTLIAHGANANTLCRYSDGTKHSILYWSIITRQVSQDRTKKERLATIARMLCAKGAVLQSDEAEYVLSKADWLLGRKQIVAALDGSNKATFSYKPQDPWLRRYVLKRIMDLAYVNITSARDDSWYKAALSCSILAKDRAEEWDLASEVPEVYFNCGLLAAKTGDKASARTHLQRYLELVPSGATADRARALLGGL